MSCSTILPLQYKAFNDRHGDNGHCCSHHRWSNRRNKRWRLYLLKHFLFLFPKSLWDFEETFGNFSAIADAKEMGICRTRRRDSGHAKCKNLLPQGGEIRFQNVQFSLHGDRQEIPKYQSHYSCWTKVALVGHTGSGKTTLTKLLSCDF